MNETDRYDLQLQRMQRDCPLWKGYLRRRSLPLS